MLPIDRSDISWEAVSGLRTLRPYSRTSLRICRRLRALGIAPRTVIDAGANTGQFAAAASMILRPARIFAFEPHPDAFQRLAAHTRRIPGAVAINLALGSESGKGRLFTNSHTHASSLRRLASGHMAAFPDAVEHEPVTCDIVTLDEYFKGTLDGRDVLLKLDVQGAEREVLLGASSVLPLVDTILCEAAMEELYSGEALLPELVDLVQSHGFHLVGPVDILCSTRTERPVQTDLLFRRPPESLDQDKPGALRRPER